MLSNVAGGIRDPAALIMAAIQRGKCVPDGQIKQIQRTKTWTSIQMTRDPDVSVVNLPTYCKETVGENLWHLIQGCWFQVVAME